MIAVSAPQSRPRLVDAGLLAPSPRPVVPCRAEPPLVERQRIVGALFGDDARDDDVSFRACLVREVERLFDEAVMPEVVAVWPDVKASPFLAKWRSGYVLYCCIALSSIAFARRRPWIVRAISALLRGLGASEATYVRGAGLTLPFLFRALEPALCRRVALAAAWILVLDEALDDGMPGLDHEARSKTMRRAMRGDIDVDASPELASAAALARALRRSCTSDADGRAFDAVLVAVEGWLDGELHSVAGGVSGVSDPTGISFRMAGVTASMDILLWAVDRCGGDLERGFFYLVAELGQVVDDYLDIDKDRAQGRITPATTGYWGVPQMRQTFDAAGETLEALMDQTGEPDGPFRRLVVRTFRGEVQRMAKILVENP
jgi:hypothetical protein